jgi:hypothetical protein
MNFIKSDWSLKVRAGEVSGAIRGPSQSTESCKSKLKSLADERLKWFCAADDYITCRNEPRCSSRLDEALEKSWYTVAAG